MSKAIRNLLSALLFACALLFAMSVLMRPVHTAHAKAAINKSSAMVLKGGTIQLRITGTTKKVTWSSKKPSIASVDEDGVVTGVKKGKCYIIGKAGGKKYKCKVTVKQLSNVNTKGAQQGIDFSFWQCKINFKKFKNDGICFVIMRAGHGSAVDSTFQRNYTRAKKQGLKVGCYWYVTALSKTAAKKQVNKFLKTIKGKTFDFPVFVDIESPSIYRKGKAFCSSVVKIFCEKIKKAGYVPGWYTSRSSIPVYLTDKVANQSGYVKWVAEYYNKLNYNSSCSIWQCSNKGRVDGISGYVDLDWYFPAESDFEDTSSEDQSTDETE